MRIQLMHYGLLLVLAVFLNACTSLKVIPLPESYTQYSWGLTSWDYMAFETEKSQNIKIDFNSNKIISITASCNRFHSPILLRNKALVFGKLNSTNINCSLAENKQDQLVVNAIRDAKVIEVSEKALVLQPKNEDWPPMYFTAMPKSNQKGVISSLWEVDAKTYPCSSSENTKCLKIRELPNTNWVLFADEIQNFDFREGVRYRIKVLKSEQDGKTIYALDGILGQVLIGTRQTSFNSFPN